jgi:hypothetical protein
LLMPDEAARIAEFRDIRRFAQTEGLILTWSGRGFFFGLRAGHENAAGLSGPPPNQFDHWKKRPDAKARSKPPIGGMSTEQCANRRRLSRR